MGVVFCIHGLVDVVGRLISLKLGVNCRSQSGGISVLVVVYSLSLRLVSPVQGLGWNCSARPPEEGDTELDLLCSLLRD